MKVERTRLPGVVVFTPDVYEDERGNFSEVVNRYNDFLPVQVNQSVSKKGVIRGLHYQKNTAKLVWVVKGAIHDVAFDSETGEWIGVELSAKNRKQLYIPPNFAHGFQALEDDTIVCYLMDEYYNAKTEGGYNPRTVKWPLAEQIVSDKDKNAMEWNRENLLHM